MLDDTQHSIALGTSIGMLIGMTPTVGIQMVIVMVFAFLTHRLFRFNRVAAILTVYVSNPVTIVPIYYMLYWVGKQFVGGEVTRGQFTSLLNYEGFEGWWNAVTGLLFDIGTPLIVGTLIVAPVCGLVTYPIMRRLLQLFRKEQSDTDGSVSSESDDVDKREPAKHVG